MMNSNKENDQQHAGRQQQPCDTPPPTSKTPYPTPAAPSSSKLLRSHFDQISLACPATPRMIDQGPVRISMSPDTSTKELLRHTRASAEQRRHSSSLRVENPVARTLMDQTEACCSPPTILGHQPSGLVKPVATKQRMR